MQLRISYPYAFVPDPLWMIDFLHHFIIPLQHHHHYYHHQCLTPFWEASSKGWLHQKYSQVLCYCITLSSMPRHTLQNVRGKICLSLYIGLGKNKHFNNSEGHLHSCYVSLFTTFSINTVIFFMPYKRYYIVRKCYIRS